MIEEDWAEYGGGGPRTFIEANGPGNVVIDNLPSIPERVTEAARFTMSKPVKERLINNLVRTFEADALAYSREACRELDRELRGYQWDDKNIPQDTVMALALALNDTAATGPSSSGKWKSSLFRDLNELGGGGTSGPPRDGMVRTDQVTSGQDALAYLRRTR
jgi:hypothetical protein